MGKDIVPIPNERIVNQIFLVRDRKVMLDHDLADLYGVTTGNLNKATKRNSKRFPDDFMFRLNEKEYKSLVFQTGISKRGGSRFLPYAFTEQGVAMLSSVLNSDRAIEVNIQIMRVFSRLRQLLETNEVLSRKLAAMESKYDGHFKIVFKALRRFVVEEQKPKHKLGFDTKKK